MVVRLIFGQPMIIGTVLLIVLKGAFSLRRLRTRELETLVMGEPSQSSVSG
jgi:hypothetical protein